MGFQISLNKRVWKFLKLPIKNLKNDEKCWHMNLTGPKMFRYLFGSRNPVPIGSLAALFRFLIGSSKRFQENPLIMSTENTCHQIDIVKIFERPQNVRIYWTAWVYIRSLRLHWHCLCIRQPYAIAYFGLCNRQPYAIGYFGKTTTDASYGSDRNSTLFYLFALWVLYSIIRIIYINIFFYFN